MKEYEINEETYTDSRFGTGIVITAKKGTTGKDRFYVMALDDFGQGILCDWYNSAKGSMDDYETYTSTDFGKGKENTIKMIERWKKGNVENGGYGEKNQCQSHKDIWGQIQLEVENGWFIPSKEELGAFAGAFYLTNGGYSQRGLKYRYWSSSQLDTEKSWCASFTNGGVYGFEVSDGYYLRLTTTF